MPRPQKEGLDYFSVDCQFSDSVKLIQAEFGLVGIGVLIRLWQKIYGEKGYYTKWDADVAMMFASECNVGVNVVCEVVSACLRRGLFDKNAYDRHSILTSASIQMRFAEATSRRESQKVFASYLLIPVRKNWVFVDNNSQNVDNNSQNVDDNPQSKVKESKVKNIELSNDNSPSNPTKSSDFATDRFERFWSAYPKKQGKEEARKRFKKINPSEALLQRMLFAIEEQKKSNQWKAEQGRFIPNPSTWLNRGQWEDETLPEIPVAQDVGTPIGSSFDTDDLFQAALKRSSGDWLKN